MKTRKEFFMYTLLEFSDIEKRLEQRALEGWRLKKTGTFIWTYEEAEPKKVHYSIVFFPKTDALAPEPPESLVMMREFCEKTGWELVAERGQMQVFCNEETNPVPIETEAWIQVKNIHETMKKGFVLPYGILLGNSILQLGTQAMQFLLSPLEWLCMGFNFFMIWCWLGLGIGCTVEVIHYYAWYKKAKRIAEEEETLYLPKSINGFRITYLTIAMVALILAIVAISNFTTIKYGWFIVVWSLILVGVPIGGSQLLKKRKVSAKWNRIAIVIFTIVATIGMVLTVVISVAKDADFIFRRDEEMSLQISDFREVEIEEDLREYSRRSDSVFLSREEGHQSERWEEDENVSMLSSIDYTILVVKTPFLYDFCKKELMTDKDNYYVDEELGQRGYRKVDMPQWGSEEVYQHYDYDGEPENEYFICYEDSMIQIDFGWHVTDEDIAKIRECMSKALE